MANAKGMLFTIKETYVHMFQLEESKGIAIKPARQESTKSM